MTWKVIAMALANMKVTLSIFINLATE